MNNGERFHSAPRPRPYWRPTHPTRRIFRPALLGPRVDITRTSAAGRYSLFGRTLAWTSADPAYGNRFTSTGKELLIAHNNGSSVATVTVKSVSDNAIGRTGDQTLQIAVGDIANFGSFPTNGWRHSDGYIYVDSDSSSVRFAVVILP